MPLTLRDFDFELPPELIAQQPAAERSASRLLDATGAAAADRRFADLPSLLAAGDLLVVNDTRVIRARLRGAKPSGGAVEALVERVLPGDEVLAHLRASKTPKAGSTIRFAGAFDAEVLGRGAEDASAAAALFRLRFPSEPHALLERHGRVPLPPYIEHDATAQDAERYQTVFAARPGAVAAPTAALHFDAALLQRLDAAGVSRATVTLHVGAGTFQPVRTDDLAQHRMHREWYDVPPATAAAIARTRAAGGRVVAVGTTTLRALEAAALAALAVHDGAHDRAHDDPRDGAHPGAHDGTNDRVPGGAGGAVVGAAARAVSGVPGPAGRATVALATGPRETDLFITPGFRFRVVDRLVTNFHLPKSTLMVLVGAFAGHDRVMALYRHAIGARYRFFSYGDAMLLARDEAGTAASRTTAGGGD